jgi:sigma-E factor negative regulatory protein RseC
MIEEEAQVIDVNDQHITLQAQPSSACSSCQAKNACGQGLLSRFFNQKPGQIIIENVSLDSEFADLKVGDRVLIGIEENAVLNAAFYVYMLPLLSFVGFAVLAQALNIESEIQQIFLTILGLFLGISAARFLLRDKQSSRQHLKRVMPTLLKKYPASNKLVLSEEII